MTTRLSDRDEALVRQAGVALRETITDHRWLASDEVLTRLICLAQRAVLPEGFVAVPREPTSEMTIAGGEAQQKSIGSWGEPKVVYWAMLAAAPEVPHV